MEKIYGSPIRQDGLMKVGRNRWDLFYGFGKDDDNEVGWNWRKTFDHQPTLEEVKDTIITQINSNAQKAILEGYEWNGHQVWLSDENLRNYTLAYGLAKDGDLKSMPTVKLGSDDNPLLYAFKNEMCFPLTKTKCELKKHPNSKFECFFNDFNRTKTSLFLPFPSKLIQDNLVCVLELQE